MELSLQHKFRKKYFPRSVELAGRKLLHTFRVFNNHRRLLPNFIIIGAQKAGTTSLYHYLSQHPQVFQSFEKEVHYFDGGLQANIDNYAKGLNWYRANFPCKSYVGADGVVGEATPLYMFHPLVPERLAKVIPNVKIISILRNPTERAISHYFHEKKKGYEILPISAALKIEEDRISESLRTLNFNSKEFIHFSYKSRGLYKEQLARYYSCFPNLNIHIIESSDFQENPNAVLKRVFEFLGIDAQFKVKDLQPQNVGQRSMQVPQDIYDFLDEYFYPHNQKLFDFIGNTFSW